MITWSTYIKAICPITGELLTFESGIKIEAPSRSLALDWAQDNGYGFLHIGDAISYVYDTETKESISFEHYLN